MFQSKTVESLFASKESYYDFSSLTDLRIYQSPNFVSLFKGGIPPPNVRLIRIRDCSRLKSLPKNMCTLLPSLEIFEVNECPELESFPKGGLPLNLVRLSIWQCDKQFSSRTGWGLHVLHSLREIRISSNCKEVESFPEEALLPPTLTDISIASFPNLKSLKGFQHFTSLKNLKIKSCHKLQYLPEDGLPTSLSILIIVKCPLLKERCVREKGEEWPKIAHIPSIEIDYELIT